jgi:hypothetical protein
MHSNKKLLFLATQQLLAAIVDTDDSPVIKYIDQDLGQLDEQRPPVSWPCALIDIDESTYAELGNGIQNGTTGVNIRLGFPPYSQTSNLTPAEYREKALRFYDIEQLIYLKLHNQWPATATVKTLNTDNTTTTQTIDLTGIYGPYIRAHAYTQLDTGPIRIRVIKFTLTDYDDTAQQGYTYIPTPDINLTTEIDNTI